MLDKYTMLYAVIFLLSITASGMAQSHEVTGTVTDAETGESLPGVNIMIQGTSQGTTTGLDGEYQISTGIDDVLVYSYVGYETIEVPVDGRNVISIELSQAAVMGDEIVVIGYGQQRERDLTGSISTVSSEDFENITVKSPERLLQGKVAGVQLISNSGQPGAATTMRIRGGASVNAGNSPLFVIDGVPIDMNVTNSSSGIAAGPGINPLSSINPKDIESLSVLKDASATAIYGARGSNGVVIINTKSGSTGDPTINISTSSGMQEVRKKISVLNAEQFARVKNEALINSGSDPIYSDQEIASFGSGTDWQDKIFRVGSLQDYNLSVSGGNEATQYFVSGNYSQNSGVVIGSNFESYSGRFNITTDISDNLTIGNNFTVSRNNSDIIRSSIGTAGSGTGIVASALFMNPIQKVKNSDGSYVQKNDAGRDFPNPVASAREFTNTSQNTRFINNSFVELNLWEKLQIKSSVGFNIHNNEEVQFKPDTIFLFGSVENEAQRGVLGSDYWVNSNIITYNTSLGNAASNQSLELMGGFTVENESRERLTAGATQFPNNLLKANNLSAGSQFLTPQSYSESFTLVSYLSRINYSYGDRYIVTANARIDGSSRFGENNKYGFFPSGAFAWRLSNEKFINRLELFSDLKLRASYGKTGNQDIGSYQSLSLLSPTAAMVGSELAIGFAPENLGNPDLKWETTTQFNVGLDMTTWSGLISINADYYNKVTNDLLFSLPLPPTTGYSSVLTNLGEVNNSGFEFGVNANSISIGEASLNLGFNFATNNNEISDLGNLDPFLVGQEVAQGTGNIFLIDEGLALGSFYGRVFNGLDQNGNVTYKDLNGDGEITADDRKIIGESQPKYTGGISGSLYYRNFEFSLNMNYVLGNDLFNVSKTELNLPNGLQNNSTDVLNRWTTSNTDTNIPQANTGRGIIFDDRYLEDGSYLRLQNVTIGYNLPTGVLSSLNIKNMRIYLSAENLFTLTEYTGYDPEVSTFGQSTLSQGIDYGVYPSAKTYRGGIELTF